jgi:NADH-quinone oxidoreductase subunit M
MTLDGYLLSLLIFSPLLGIVVLLFVPGKKHAVLKSVGIAATVVPLLLSVALVLAFDFGDAGYQFVEEATWIELPLPGVETAYTEIGYNLGVDGLAVSLILLTAVVSTIAAFASLSIDKRLKEYFILFLLLEIGMLGVFAAQNLFLFFIFFMNFSMLPIFLLFFPVIG